MWSTLSAFDRGFGVEKRMLKSSRFWAFIASTGFFAIGGQAFGAVAIATDFQIGNGVDPFTPSYVVSTSDLIQGMAPSASAGNFAAELSGGLPVLTDGTFGQIFTGVSGNHPAFATGGGGNGTGSTVTYALNTAASPLGYNISNITTYGGWNDNGRDQQSYTVAYSTAAAPGTFINLTPVNFNPVVANGLQSAVRIIITDDALPFLATGVAAVRFTFDPSAENGYSGYAEFDVNGSPVPEPAALGLFSAGAMALLARRRAVR
jgi:hypothetical protein